MGSYPRLGRVDALRLDVGKAVRLEQAWILTTSITTGTIFPFGRPHAPRSAVSNIGYWIRSTATGRGAATAATQLLTQWALEKTDLNRLAIVVSTRNAASLRVAEKAGAVREGVLRKRLMLGGEAHDAVMFSFIRDAH